MYQDAADADRIGRLNDALRGVPEESAAKTAPLPGTVYCQAPQNDDRDRIGHIPSKSGRVQHRLRSHPMPKRNNRLFDYRRERHTCEMHHSVDSGPAASAIRPMSLRPKQSSQEHDGRPIIPAGRVPRTTPTAPRFEDYSGAADWVGEVHRGGLGTPRMLWR